MLHDQLKGLDTIGGLKESYLGKRYDVLQMKYSRKCTHDLQEQDLFWWQHVGEALLCEF